MTTPIHIIFDDHELAATLQDTPTAQAVTKALPMEGRASVWGDEIYFTVPIRLDLEPDAKEQVEVGALAYWPQGPALCIFFGPTPVSVGDEPRAYSPVNVFGSVEGDVEPLRRVRDGDTIRIERASD